MSYIDKVIQPGEELRYRSTIHWIVYSTAIFFLVIAIGGGMWMAIDAQHRPAELGVVGVSLVLAILNFIPAWLKRMSTEIAVTNRRVIYKVGLVSRHTIEMNMDKVESVDVEQSLLGRMFDYGDILVRGTGASLEPLRQIDNPLDFRNMIIAR